MKQRIKKLREQSLNAKPVISTERALLLTEFYQKKDANGASIPLQRALAFKYILENKKICVNKGELIVGERGPEPKATPTYPEICVHSIKDLNILDSREKISFSSNSKTKNIYMEKIIPFWKGRSIRDRIFNHMDEEWKQAYKTGIFTEFLEQRAPGHTVNGNKIYNKGFDDIRLEIKEDRKSVV